MMTRPKRATVLMNSSMLDEREWRDGVPAGGRVAQRRKAVTIAPTDGPDAIEQSNRAFGSLLERLDAAPQLIVSAVEGAAFGGGCGLVCASDMVIAMADARFALSETTLGVVPARRVLGFRDPRELVPALGQTARLVAIYGVLLGSALGLG